MADHIIGPIAILGGTGREGKGLAYRWAKSGYQVLIGSREVKKAKIVAAEISEILSNKAIVIGLSNLEAVKKAEIVTLSVPYKAHREILETLRNALKGKTLIDVTVPLVPPEIIKVQMPPAGSAAQEAHEILGNDVQLASAFQNISFERLMQEEPIDCDVLVTGTSKQVRFETLELVAAAGFTGWDAGPIENSVVIEGLTSVLIGINKQYGSKSAGIRITGVRKNV